MYGLIWRALPGPTWLRALLALALAALVVVVLYLWVFPWVATVMPFNDQTVQQSPAAGS